MNEFDKILTSLSPDELPELTLSSPSSMSSARIKRLVKRKLRSKPSVHDRSIFVSRGSMRGLYAALACFVLVIGVLFVRNDVLRYDFVGSLTGLFTGLSPTLETTSPDEADSPTLTKSDARLSVSRITTASDAGNTEITLHVSYPGHEGEFLLYEGLRLSLNGREYYGMSGRGLGDSYLSILAGDILAVIGSDGYELSFTVKTDELGAGSFRLEIDSLWSALLYGKQTADELTTTPIGEDIALEFTIPSYAASPASLPEASAEFKSSDGRFTINRVDVGQGGKNPKLTLNIVGEVKPGDLLMCNELRLSIDGKELVEKQLCEIEDTYNALLAGDILAEADEDGFELSFDVNAYSLSTKRLTLEIDSLWSATFVGERGEELVTKPLGENIVFEFTVG